MKRPAPRRDMSHLVFALASLALGYLLYLACTPPGESAFHAQLLDMGLTVTLVTVAVQTAFGIAWLLRGYGDISDAGPTEIGVAELIERHKRADQDKKGET